EALAITPDQMRKMLFEERKENLVGTGLQEHWRGAECGSAAARGGCANLIQAFFGVVDEGHDGMRQHTDGDSRRGELPQRGQSQFGTRCARFEEAGEALIERRNGEMD